MRGASSRSCAEFEMKMIQWEGKLLKYEQRVSDGDGIKEPDKCRILFDMLPQEAQNKHDDLLELSSSGGRAEMKLCLQLYNDGPSPGGKPNALLYRCFFRLPDNGIFMFGPEPCLTQEKVNK